MHCYYVDSRLGNIEMKQKYPQLNKLLKNEIPHVGPEFIGRHALDPGRTLQFFKSHYIKFLLLHSETETRNPVVGLLKENGIQTYNENQLDEFERNLASKGLPLLYCYNLR